MFNVLKAKTEKKIKKKKIGWPRKKGIFEFWNKNLFSKKKYKCLGPLDFFENENFDASAEILDLDF